MFVVISISDPEATSLVPGSVTYAGNMYISCCSFECNVLQKKNCITLIIITGQEDECASGRRQLFAPCDHT